MDVSKLTDAQKERRRRLNKKILLFGFLPLMAIIVIIVATDKPDPIHNSSEPTPKVSPAEALVVLDTNAPADTTSTTFIRTKYLISSLAELYMEPEDTIAEYTSKAKGLLHDNYGIDESCLDILESMKKAGHPKTQTISYKDAIVVYTILRSK